MASTGGLHHHPHAAAFTSHYPNHNHNHHHQPTHPSSGLGGAPHNHVNTISAHSAFPSGRQTVPAMHQPSFGLAGPFPSLEYAQSVAQYASTNSNGITVASNAASKPANNSHHMMQLHRHGLSGQCAAPHFHARQVIYYNLIVRSFTRPCIGRSSCPILCCRKS